MKNENKKEYILFTCIFLILIIINNLCMNSETSLLLKVLLDAVVGVAFVLISYKKLKTIKNLYRDIFFIYGFVFFVYSIVGCIVFILDNYSPRFYFFEINETILSKTMTIYINVLCIYAFLVFTFNKMKYVDYDEFVKKDATRFNITNKNLIVFDIIAFIVSFGRLIQVISCGIDFFEFTTAVKRSVINNDISHYINLFMVIYSLFVSLLLVINKDFRKNKYTLIRIIAIILYWLISLTCERRMFVIFLVGVFFIALFKVSKINIKKIVLFLILMITFLFSAATRDNINFFNHSFVDVIYSSTTEFYCTFMISDAYTYDTHELEYGKTYIVDSLSKLLPRVILKNKPDDLSQRFKDEYNTNVGFAFNPVAEGILNFGIFAPIFVALIMFVICIFAQKMSKYNILYLIVMLSFSLDFCRGAFSNLFFDTIFCFILIFMIYVDFNTIKDILNRIILKSIFVFLRIFKIKDNKIVITSYYGKGYGDNSKYICKELLARNKKYDIVWLVNNMESIFPDGIRKVKYKSLKSFYELVTAKVWIDNSRKHDYILKRKGQYYIQTWHSSLRLKKIEADAVEDLPSDYIRNAKQDSKKMDLLTVGCGLSEETYDRAFWYKGPKLRCGTPRCDIFFNKKEKDKIKRQIKKRYNINDNAKIILYAPTFKKNSKEEIIDFEEIVEKLYKYGKYVFLVRFHPISKNKITETENVINVTDYPDIQEIITMCDYLVTDYSGCCFDAMFAQKSCLLYTPDYNEYIKKERKLAFDFDSLPFKRTYTIDELVNEIGEFDYNKYMKQIEDFSNKINSYERGNASKKIVDIIDERIGNKYE